MNEEKDFQTPPVEDEPDITEFSLHPSSQGKPPKKISVAAAIILAVFIGIAAFMLAFVVVRVQTASQLREIDEIYGKYSKMEDLLNHLDANYVRDYDENAVWEGMYKAIFDSIGDPYSTYMTKEEYAAYKADRSGNYVGIGINVVYTSEYNECYVYRVTKGSPAEKAGILAGDIITMVEDIEITPETYHDAIDAVAGEEGTSVNLTLIRDGQTIKMIVMRNKLETINVLYEKLPENVAYITIISFAEAVTYDQFAQALEQAKKDNVKGYIFDVRNNPGGSLDVICKCLDLLLPEGIIVNIVAPDGTTTTLNPAAWTSQSIVLDAEGTWTVTISDSTSNSVSVTINVKNVVKFEAKKGVSSEAYKTITLGDLFSLVEGATVSGATATVTAPERRLPTGAQILCAASFCTITVTASIGSLLSRSAIITGDVI